MAWLKNSSKKIRFQSGIRHQVYCSKWEKRQMGSSKGIASKWKMKSFEVI
jgi:hypothetical protein